jgi:hypothetical protein
MRRLLTTILAFALAALLPAAAARADGDPASDVLLGDDAFLPYQPKVPSNVDSALRATLKKMRAAGYPLKVAVIASKDDLGAVPNYFGHPQDYAGFLQGEIAFNKPEPLLIVMPNGYGFVNAGANAGKAIGAVEKPVSASGDALGRAAIDASLALAKADGHPVPAPTLPKASGGGGGGGSSSPLLVFGVPVLLLALGGGLAAVRQRQRDREAEPPRPVGP